MSRLFPPGEFSGERTVAAARMASELVRYLNHATRGASSLSQPAEAAEVVSALSTMVGRLTQTMGQVASQVCEQAEDPRLLADGLGPVPATGASGLAYEAAVELALAERRCGEVGAAMSIAQRRMSRLYLADDQSDDQVADSVSDGW